MRGWHVVLALALLTAAACAGRGDVEGEADGEAGGTLQVAGEEANDHGTADVTGRAEVEMELDDFYFEPTVLSGQAGQTLTVKMFNEGDQAHTFTIGSIGVDVEVPQGDEAEAEVTIPKAGALLYLCRFHAAQGMRGGLSAGGDLKASGEAGVDLDNGGGGDTGDDPYG